MAFETSFNIGEAVSNADLTVEFKVANMGGMRRSIKTNTLVVISDHTKGLYDDKWSGDVLHYTGMGKIGNQEFNRQNKTLNESKTNGISVQLFEVLRPKEYIYRGEVKLCDAAYYEKQKDDEGSFRQVIMFPLKLIGSEENKAIKMKNAAIITTIKELKEIWNKESFVKACHTFVEKACGLETGNANDISWADCYDFLIKNLPKDEAYENFNLIFEYIMPDSQKRADVILLTMDKVIILEFKRKNEILKNDISQVGGYAQSIKHYHSITAENNMTVFKYMVFTLNRPTGRHDLVDILWSDNFTHKISNIVKNEKPLSDSLCKDWMDSPFVPLKSLADATLQLFKEGELPNIKTIREGDIKDALDTIDDIIDLGEKNIIFVSGVPGAGKTLVGLKTVYDHADPGRDTNPIYLSGNDPLINILQNTLSTYQGLLDGKSYIQAMKYYKKWARNRTIPPNNIIVFDEAQRAWDVDYKEPGETEAKLLLRIGDKIAHKYGQVTILCLIGDGQAIHKHEETGMPIWKEALNNRDDWTVYVPENYYELFQSLPTCTVRSKLRLDIAIRNDFINIGPWVEAILDLNLDKAKKLYQDMLEKGFNCWIYREPECLKKTVNWVKEKHPGSHTGIIVSSHLKNNVFGNQYRGSYVRADEAYHWYMKESEELSRGASEFLIQGIELEYPIVCFIGDYYIKEGKWHVDYNATCDREIQDLSGVIKNVYRVLLSRSRKGNFIYIPKESKMDETYFWLKKILNIKNDVTK